MQSLGRVANTTMAYHGCACLCNKILVGRLVHARELRLQRLASIEHVLRARAFVMHLVSVEEVHLLADLLQPAWGTRLIQQEHQGRRHCNTLAKKDSHNRERNGISK